MSTVAITPLVPSGRSTPSSDEHRRRVPRRLLSRKPPPPVRFCGHEPGYAVLTEGLLSAAAQSRI